MSLDDFPYVDDIDAGDTRGLIEEFRYRARRGGLFWTHGGMLNSALAILKSLFIKAGR